MSMMQEGTYAHRAPLWKNGLIFMFLVHRIMTKIYEAIFTAVVLLNEWLHKCSVTNFMFRE